MGEKESGMNKKKGLQKKFLWLFLLFTLIPAVLVAGVNTFLSVKAQKENAFESNTTTPTIAVSTNSIGFDDNAFNVVPNPCAPAAACPKPPGNIDSTLV